MGIDVLYTRYDQSTHEYYLLMFYSNTNPLSPELKLKAEIEEFKKNNKLFIKYIENKSTYRRNYDAMYNSLHTEFKQKIPLNANSPPGTVIDAIRILLKRAIDIAYFTSISPRLNITVDDDTFFRTYIIPNVTPDISAANISGVRQYFAVYRENYQILNKLVSLDIFENTDPRKSKICKDRYKAVDAIRVFDRDSGKDGKFIIDLFSKKDADDPRKGAGVFVYLDPFLSNDNKKIIIDELTTMVKDKIEDKKDNKIKLEAFITTAKFLLNVQEPASASASAPASALVPAVPEVLTSELLETINISDKRHIPEHADEASTAEMTKKDIDEAKEQETEKNKQTQRGKARGLK
jgi:hypothetical protein